MVTKEKPKPRTGLKKILIYTDLKGDRNCPSCQSEEIVLMDPYLTHGRTTLRIDGYCVDCGCDFTFKYLLFVDNVEIRR